MELFRCSDRCSKEALGVHDSVNAGEHAWALVSCYAGDCLRCWSSTERLPHESWEDSCTRRWSTGTGVFPHICACGRKERSGGHLVAAAWHGEEALAVAEGVQRRIGAAEACQVALCWQRDNSQSFGSDWVRAAGMGILREMLLWLHPRLLLRFARAS